MRAVVLLELLLHRRRRSLDEVDHRVELHGAELEAYLMAMLFRKSALNVLPHQNNSTVPWW